MEKISSGVENMDPLLGGGYPKSSTIAYYGPPGTGKTISSFFFLLDGLKKQEKVLHVTFEEGGEDFFALAKSLGVDLEIYLESGHLIIKDFSHADSEEGLIQDVIENVKENYVTRIVVDSLTTAILDHVSEDSFISMRRFTRKLLRSIKSSGATSIVISRDEEEYGTLVGLSDCAVYFQPHLMGEDGLSSCNIVKVRLAKHNKNMQYINLTENGEISINVSK